MTARSSGRAAWSAAIGAGFLGGLVGAWAAGAASRAAIAADQPPRAAGPSAADLLRDSEILFEQAADIVSPAVVYIEARHRDQRSRTPVAESGSGVVVRPPGRQRAVVVTNLHVVAEAAAGDIDIYFADGRVVHPTQVWTDGDTDLALLAPPMDDLPAAKLGDSGRARIGQWVLAIGSPFGLAQSVTHGIVSAKERRQVGVPGAMRIKEFLQTDAAINPGNSGGPLVNLRGEVIGINTAIASKNGSSSGVGFSIPANLVRWVCDELLTHGRVRRAFLGVQFPDRFDVAAARSLGLPYPRGALVEGVHPGSPADTAGLRQNDVVLSFDGKAVQDENHLINIVAQTPIGKKVAIQVWRDGAEKPLATLLSSWDEYRQQSAEPNRR